MLPFTQLPAQPRWYELELHAEWSKVRANVSQALHDLLGRPEYIEPLREEIAEVIKEDGVEKDENGQVFLSKSSMGKLKKLDSFIKESQRTSPLSFGKLLPF